MLQLYSVFRIALAVMAALSYLLGGTARAAEGRSWRGLGDTVFVPAGHGPDQPAELMPLALAEDAQGFIWAAGEAGLERWDGYHFRAYTADRSPPDGLNGHYMQALHLDRAGRLWVGSSSGALAIYDPRLDHFVDIPLDPQAGGARSIWVIEDDGAGGIWVATDSGLFRLDAAGAVTEHRRHDPKRPGGLPENKVQAFLRDRQGGLWVGGRSGLFRATADNQGFAPIPLPAPGGETPEVSHLFQDDDGRIWIGTRQHGAFVIGSEGGGARPVDMPPDRPGAPPAMEIMAIAQIASDTVWLATFGGGVVEVDAASLASRRIRHDPMVAGSLDSNSVYALHRDRSGLIWAGTTRGLSLYRPSSGIISILGDPARTSGLAATDITAELARPDGTYWIGSQHDDIQIIDGAGNFSRGPAIQRVFNLANTPQGGVLIGTRAGLYLADGAGGQPTRLSIAGRRANAGVLSLRAEQDSVWLGGADDGLWELRIDQVGLVSVVRHLDVPVLTNADIHALANAGDGKLAIGTENGLNLLDRKTGAVEQVVADPRYPDSLPPGQVTCALTDARGRLWVGSDDAGLAIMSGRDADGRARFRRLGVADGLPNTDINQMMMDRQGRVWVSTDNGLAVIDADTLAVHALHAADGVAISTYWSDPGIVTPEGALIFGGMGGMTVVQPDRIGTWQYRPPTVVTDIRVGAQTGDALARNGALSVAPDDDSLAVEFASLDFSSPSSNRYRYRLEGYDRGWQQTDANHRIAAYTNLSPGSYTLRVQGSNRDGVWSEQPATLGVTVRAAWFQAGWFRMLEGAGAGLLVFAVVQARTFILRRRQRELEQQVADRTAELTVSQEELRHFAYVDTLTGLPNRRAFNDAIAALLHSVPPRPFALMLIDLDGFKGVNDTLGHDAGDAVLLLAADRISLAVREGDFLGRLGGDEFAVLLHDAHASAAVAGVGERITGSMAAITALGDTPIKIGASAGAALFPQDGTSQEELYKHADMALYEAKRSGRGVWRAYSQALAVSPL